MGASAQRTSTKTSEFRVARNVKAAGFDPERRREVSDLAKIHPRIADLTTSFPGLLFSLATGYGRPSERARALETIQAGTPLRTVATQFGLPFWLRRLPASAFTFPIAKLPSTPSHTRRIASVIPLAPIPARNWLWALHYATSAGHADFGVWIAEQAAKHPSRFRGAPGRMALRHLTVWAWHANNPHTLGHAYLLRPWSPDLGFKRAMEEMCRWRARVDLARTLAQRSTTTRWMKEGEAIGYRFKELITIEDFIEESEAMDNCLDQFSNQLVARESQIFSVRLGDRPIANVEVGRHDSEATMPSILQLRGPRNRRASGRVWQATYAWLGAQRLAPRRMTLKRPNAKRSVQAFEQAFWTPYLSHLQDQRLPPNLYEEVLLTFDLDRSFLSAKQPSSYGFPAAVKAPTDGKKRKTKASSKLKPAGGEKRKVSKPSSRGKLNELKPVPSSNSNAALSAASRSS
ncbi:MAG: hypothetical protein AAFV69_15245 [Pseudomonadota bacterium]